MKPLIIACLIILKLFSTPLVADDEAFSSGGQNTIERSVIRLDADAQKLAGIETITLKSANHQAEFTAYGKAIAIQPLLTLRSSVDGARSDSLAACSLLRTGRVPPCYRTKEEAAAHYEKLVEESYYKPLRMRSF